MVIPNFSPVWESFASGTEFYRTVQDKDGRVAFYLAVQQLSDVSWGWMMWRPDQLDSVRTGDAASAQEAMRAAESTQIAESRGQPC